MVCINFILSINRKSSALRCRTLSTLSLMTRVLRIPPLRKTKNRDFFVSVVWRRERDSNPRYVLPYTRFPIVRLRPAQPSLHICLFCFFVIPLSERGIFAQYITAQVDYPFRPRKQPLGCASRIAEPSVRFTVHTISNRAP